ncbi:MAG: EamA family transporter [Calditrichaeota bacterium]|nr:MAG: EamA family transporter [Calditrichota bacterium]MBL1205292.1 EamA family transporter [Calditrichota bacterium]NOG45121.1 EamA family transporter [Calditrichota bacterium]
MIYLLIVSIIWALSFGLIKGNLAGLDSHFIAFARLSISFVFFGAFLRIKQFQSKQLLLLMTVGAVQFGLMYIFYIYAYNYLQAWQIALFTIFTPLYVTLINDILSKRFHLFFLLMAILSIFGAAIIVFKNIPDVKFQLGFLLMQLSNICFAVGQVYYKKIRQNFLNVKDVHLFSWLYFGAFIISGTNSFFMTDWDSLVITTTHFYTLLYLGILASGICFFLWNYGAVKVNAGTLAVFNNLKVPLGVAFSIFIFSESGDFLKMIIGGTIIISAIYLAGRFDKKRIPKIISR